MTEAFLAVDEVLLRGVQGISDIITVPGLINVDFADVRSVMESSGSALMGIGRGAGEGRAVEAAKSAVNSPLLETSIRGASGVIINVTGGMDIALHEVVDAAKIITDAVSDDATVHFGAVTDERIQGEIQITVIATGFDLKNQGIDILSAKTEKKDDGFTLPPGLFGDLGNTQTTTSQPKTAKSSIDLDIPDFLKK